MASKFLLVGTASDGPVNQILYPANRAELNKIFGGTYIQREIVNATASSVLLHYDTVSLPKDVVDERSKRLFSPYEDDGVLYFGTLGGSGTSTLDLYYNPYLGKEDVLVAANRTLDIANQMPHVCRIGGTSASVNVSGWNFQAIYPGNKYNRVTITIAPSSITISGLEPMYNSRTYYSTGVEGINSIKKNILRDEQLNMLPVRLISAGTALATGTYTLSGGTNGTFSDSDVLSFLENVYIPPAISHVIFLRSITASAMDHFIDYFAQFGNQPKMFMMNAPSINAEIEVWAYDQTLEIPRRHDYVCGVLGDITVGYRGKSVTRYAVEGAAIGLMSKTNKNPTNTPVRAESFSPVLTAEQLTSIKGFGWIPLMRYIRGDISIYQAVTTANQNSFLYSSKTAEITAVASNYCQQFIGQVLSPGPKGEISRALWGWLAAEVNFVTIQNVEVIVKGDGMYVYILAHLPGEILEINFVVRSR